MNVPGIKLIIKHDDTLAMLGGIFTTGHRELTIDHRLAVLLGSEFINLAEHVASCYFDLGQYVEEKDDKVVTIFGYTFYLSDAKSKAKMELLATKFPKEKLVEYVDLKGSFIGSAIWLDNPLVISRSIELGITPVELQQLALGSYKEAKDKLLSYI